MDNVCKLWGTAGERTRLTEVLRAGVDVVAVRRGLGVRRGGVQGGALVPADRRQPRHKGRIVLERRTHHPAVDIHTLVTHRCSKAFGKYLDVGSVSTRKARQAGRACTPALTRSLIFTHINRFMTHVCMISYLWLMTSI